MIALLLSFFSSPGRIVGAVFAVALIAFSGYLKLEVIAKDHALAVAAKRADGQSARIGKLQQSLAADESALAQYEALAKAAGQAAVAAQERARKSAQATELALNALRASEPPKDCPGSVDWARKEAAGLAKGWDK